MNRVSQLVNNFLNDFVATAGLNFRTAKARYHVFLGPQAPNTPEAAILSTCNRTELYCATDDRAAREGAVRWLSEYHRIPVDELAPHVYALPQSEAVRHAFRVASGLDSMVLGETQILGQMKDAVRTATEAAQHVGDLAAEFARMQRVPPHLGQRIRERFARVLAQHARDLRLAARHQHDVLRALREREADRVVGRRVARVQRGDDGDRVGQLRRRDRIGDRQVQ
ncbi:hypothetical protein KPB08_13850, partial [Burkholderia cenocepacia]|nr:hypothetical protein [Burkholderia cenocepacia]